MSLSSYIKRQSRVLRRSVVLSGLSSIIEDPEPSSVLEPIIIPTEDEPKPTKKNSMKAKRRLGVSDLSIPHSSPLFTAVQGPDFDDDNDTDSCLEWRLRLPDDEDEDDTMVFDFPRPPSSLSSSSSSSRSGSTSPTSIISSGLPTTPTPSPTLESCAAAAAVATTTTSQCVVRCKSIKPLTITKRSRSVSPIPPACPDFLPLFFLSLVEDEDEDDDAWQDDDEFYAAHAGGFITLSPPLPPSFPSAALPSPFAVLPHGRARGPARVRDLPFRGEARIADVDAHTYNGSEFDHFNQPEFGKAVPPAPAHAPAHGRAEHAVERGLHRVGAASRALAVVLCLRVHAQHRRVLQQLAAPAAQVPRRGAGRAV
ncbi:hypothetical protein MSAN_02208400 [Mycena sanguinolenta]|uniref:Uncharacterized protein n=1 Tax=Mycena sanguinolenta TaxID=230812 RepID=A0A8H6XE81_9AGAR|nr:hypothetical protein MSAN_02208400 [Mycena sanguinolenta]